MTSMLWIEAHEFGRSGIIKEHIIIYFQLSDLKLVSYELRLDISLIRRVYDLM